MNHTDSLQFVHLFREPALLISTLLHHLDCDDQVDTIEVYHQQTLFFPFVPPPRVRVVGVRFSRMGTD